ncbi:MAG: hypothetical protein GABPV2_gp4 [Guiyang argiope bruennichi polycipivirus 2]|nr:MAG: hypothetical protein GABPV2_gp4 [Guiyang argiope bruennichi polycipivirus 2]
MSTEVVTTDQLIDTPVPKVPNVTKPSVVPITDEKIQNNFVPTGITVIVPTNLAKVNSEALFACNVDGFIPFLNTTFSRSLLWKNLFPVQVTEAGNAVTGLRVIYEYCQIPIQLKYLSYRYTSGNVKVAIRISSQTGQTGNFYITQLRSGSRQFYGTGNVYGGLKFCNASVNSLDYAPSSFAIGDLSLNRNISITPVRTNPVVYQDHARKLFDLYRFGNGSSDYAAYSPFVNQQSEDWLLFEPVMNLAGPVASEVFLTFFFDFSEVSFFVPMYPIIPIYPDLYELQILLFTETFKGQTGPDSYLDWIWYPRNVSSALGKQYPKEVFGHYAVGGSYEDKSKQTHSNVFTSNIPASKDSKDNVLYPIFKHFSRLYRSSSSSVPAVNSTLT